MGRRRNGDITRQRILEYIQQYVQVKGYMPTRREIGSALKLSMPSVQLALDALQEDGKLERDEGIARGMRLK